MKIIDGDPSIRSQKNNERNDSKEVIDGIKITIATNRESLLTDPQNIVFIALPRTWSKQEIDDKYSYKTEEERLSISSKSPFIPFIPGIRDHGAMVKIFNPITLRTGNGMIFYDSSEQVWKEKTGRTRVKHSLTSGEVAKNLLEISDTSEEDEQDFDISDHTEKEIISRLFDSINFSKLILPIQKRLDPNIARRLLEIILSIQEIDLEKEDSSNRELDYLYGSLIDLFLETTEDNSNFRHGRFLICSRRDIDFLNDDQTKISLTLI